MMDPSRPFVSAVVGGCVTLLIAATSQAATGSLKEIERAQRANQTWLRVVNTRSAFESERLRRLETLKAHGHASWLEMARQAAVVQALIEHRQAAVQFEQWLSDLREQLWPNVELTRAGRLAGSTQGKSTVEVGNHRESLTHSRAPRHLSSDEADNRNRLQLAKAAMESAQREFEALQKQQINHGTDASSSREPAPHLTQTLPAHGAFDHGAVDHDAVDERGPSRREIVWLAVYPELARATLDVAKAESQSTAFVEMAEILARKSRLRSEAIAALNEKGFTTSVELEAARNTVADAEAALAKARGLAKRRQQTWTSLKRQLAADDVVQRVSHREPTGHVKAVARNPASLRHFIAQHLAQFQAVAVRSESQIEARLLAELVRRLEQTGLDHEAARRERETARLDLDLALARGDMAGEHHVALQHQTRQFVAAVEAQNQTSMFDSLAMSAARLVAPRLAISYLQWPHARLFSNFGRPRHAALNSWIVPRCFDWSRVGFWPHRRARILPGAYARWSTSPSWCWSRRYCGLGSYLDGLYYYRSLSRVGVRPSIRPWRLPLYHDFYTFGSPRHVIWSSSLRSHCLSAHTPRSLPW